MKFAQPYFIPYFLLLAGLALFYSWAFSRRKAAIEKFAQKGILQELLSSQNTRKQKIKIAFCLWAVMLSLLALLRPQWGFHWEEVKRKGLDILIALDTSKSMLAEDIKPNRLERAKLAIRDFTKSLRGDRVGLIAFSGSAFLQCPLTIDYGGFLLTLDSLDSEAIPQGGTSISSAIKEALRGYEGGEKKYKVLIVITDGEYHEGDPQKAAEEARKAGIAIFCIGLGTKEGELIPVINEAGQREFLKDRQGNVVKSRLDEATLQKIALTTGGAYLRSTSAEFGLELLYREKLSKMEKRELKGKMNKRYEERFQIPLTLALLLFLIEPFISEKKKEN